MKNIKRKMRAIKEAKYMQMDKKYNYTIWHSNYMNIKVKEMNVECIKNIIFDLSEFYIKYSDNYNRFDKKYIESWIKVLEKELSKRYFWLENT